VPSMRGSEGGRRSAYRRSNGSWAPRPGSHRTRHRRGPGASPTSLRPNSGHRTGAGPARAGNERRQTPPTVPRHPGHTGPGLTWAST